MPNTSLHTPARYFNNVGAYTALADAALDLLYNPPTSEVARGRLLQAYATLLSDLGAPPLTRIPPLVDIRHALEVIMETDKVIRKARETGAAPDLVAAENRLRGWKHLKPEIYARLNSSWEDIITEWPMDIPLGEEVRAPRPPTGKPPLQQTLQGIIDAPESSFSHPRQRAQKLIHTIVESNEFFNHRDVDVFPVIPFDAPGSLQEWLREFGVQIPETLSEDVLDPYLRNRPWDGPRGQSGAWHGIAPRGPTNWGYAEEAIPRVIERIRREGGPSAGDKLEAINTFYGEAVIDYGQASPENDRWLRERIGDYNDILPSVDPSTRESNPYYHQHEQLQAGGLSQEELINIRERLPLEQGGYLTQEGDTVIGRRGRPQPVGMPQHRVSRLAATRRSKDMQTLWNNSVEPEFVRSNRYIHWSTLRGASKLLEAAPEGRYLGGELSARVFPQGKILPYELAGGLPDSKLEIGFLLEGDVSYIGRNNLLTFPDFRSINVGLPRQGRRYISREVDMTQGGLPARPFAMSADQLTESSEAVLREPRIVGIVSNPQTPEGPDLAKLQELSRQAGGRLPILEAVPNDPNIFRPLTGVPQPENVEQIVASVSQGGRSRVGAVTEVADVAGQYPMFPPEDITDVELERRIHQRYFPDLPDPPAPESPPTRQGPHPAQQELFSPGEIGGAQGPEDLQARGSTMVPRSDDLPPPPPVGERSPPGSLTAARNAAAARATEEANRARMLRNAGIRSGLETLGTAAEVAALGYNTIQEGDPLRGAMRTGAETIEGVGSILRAPEAAVEMAVGPLPPWESPLRHLSETGDAITRIASPYRRWQEREARIRENTPDRVTQQREARNEAARRALAPKE